MEMITSITNPTSATNGHDSDPLDLTSALEAAQELSNQAKTPELLHKLTEIMIEAAGSQRGYLLLPEQDQWQVVTSARTNASGVQVAPGTPVNVTLPMNIINYVARTREPVLVNDATTPNPFAGDPNLVSSQPTSILCLPILNQDQLPGIVYMENLLTPHTFSPGRLKLLKLLATQAAICLQTANLVNGLEQAETSARANEQRFRHLFENAPLCIFEVDLSSTPPVILAANRRAEAVYGWSAQEFTAVPPGTLVPAEARPEIERLTECVRTGETVTIETTNRRRDGSIFPARIIATPEIEMGPHADHMVVAVEDITASRQRRSEVEAIDEERRRIAQEIHDGVAQDMAALRMRTTVWHDLVDTNPAQMHAELDELQTILDAGIGNMRRAIFALRPVALDEVGLFQALHQLVADFENQYQVYVDLRITGPEERLPSKLELPLFRVAQEALHNVGKHAQASLIWLAVDLRRDNEIRLAIRDNGQGFDPASLEGAVRGGHLGLKQMRERVEAAQGTLEIKSQPGQGTQVQVVLPLG